MIVKAHGYCANRAHLYKAEDSISACFLFENGLPGSGSWCFVGHQSAKQDCIEIIGEKGTLSFSVYTYNPIRLITTEGAVSITVPNPPYVQLPIIKSVIEDLQGIGVCQCRSVSATPVNWVMVGVLALLCLVDMWQVNKRYLNDDMFVSNTIRDSEQEMTATDKQILMDKDPDYRVLNFASDTFNENETSYYHKSIGGYHAAKLRRYQELIERYISPEMQTTMNAVISAQGDMTKVNGDSIYPVINMLNTKYFIFPLQGGQTTPIKNPYAQGQAWFVDEVKYVDNANQELDALGKENLHNVAVADKKFENVLGKSNTQDSTSMAKVISYEPNSLTYDVSSKNGGVLVFSEIYYNGRCASRWRMPVIVYQGQQQQIFREP